MTTAGKRKKSKLPRSLVDFMDKLDLELVEDEPASDEEVGKTTLERMRGLKIKVVFLFSQDYRDVTATVFLGKRKLLNREWEGVCLEDIFPVVYLDVIGHITQGLSRIKATQKVYSLSKKGRLARERAKKKHSKLTEFSAQKKNYDRIKSNKTYLKAGERLKGLRLKKGLTQRSFFEATGITQMTLIKWEKGRGRPGRENMGRLSIYYDVPYLEIKRWFDECED